MTSPWTGGGYIQGLGLKLSIQLETGAQNFRLGMRSKDLSESQSSADMTPQLSVLLLSYVEREDGRVLAIGWLSPINKVSLLRAGRN